MTQIFKLLPHQEAAVDHLQTGSILCGGVGSGKSLTAIAYYLKDHKDKEFFVITTAKKRDSLDWEHECDRIGEIRVTVDSWNNIGKYTKIESAFFVFDEQRVVGSGSWVKSFLKITKKNDWILLSATPGDSWMDYVPVFVANGFYKNRTEFIREHVIYKNFRRYPVVDRYVGTDKLMRLRQQVIVDMAFKTPVTKHVKSITLPYDKEKMEVVTEKRWNPFENHPIRDISEYCYTMRKIVNIDPSRLEITRELIAQHRKVIVFYNFNYELEILRKLSDNQELTVAEYNGQKHEEIPAANYWAYLVQFNCSEGWNCVETNTIVFYSKSYSYRGTIQAAGRINRLNTPFANLYYYHLTSASRIDIAINEALRDKKDFNESLFRISEFA